jgi:hypothetical protein
LRVVCSALIGRSRNLDIDAASLTEPVDGERRDSKREEYPQAMIDKPTDLRREKQIDTASEPDAIGVRFIRDPNGPTLAISADNLESDER